MPTSGAAAADRGLGFVHERAHAASSKLNMQTERDTLGGPHFLFMFRPPNPTKQTASATKTDSDTHAMLASVMSYVVCDDITYHLMQHDG